MTIACPKSCVSDAAIGFGEAGFEGFSAGLVVCDVGLEAGLFVDFAVVLGGAGLVVDFAVEVLAVVFFFLFL